MGTRCCLRAAEACGGRKGLVERVRLPPSLASFADAGQRMRRDWECTASNGAASL